MATTPNKNPVPSEEYANMRFNAGKLDEFINATVGTYVDRLGITHMTVKGLQAAAVGALLPGNNLSDVANVTTARTNLSAAKSGANTDITSITGVAATATKLVTARALISNLSSSSSVNFDGSANATLGVSGTLPIANGGTGATTAATALASIGGKANAGIVDASSAASGVVGEYISSTAAQSISNATVTGIAALTLTPGDWDVSGVVSFNSSGASYSALNVGLSTVNTSQASYPNAVQIAGSLSGSSIIEAPLTRFNVSVSTIIYLVVIAYFSSGTTTVNGFIRARRIR